MTHYGTLVYQGEFAIFELHSTDYSDALWMTEKWNLPLYSSSGPAEDWYLIHNPHPRANYPEQHPREGI